MIIINKNYESWTKAFSESSTFTGKMALNEIVKFEDGSGNGLSAKITTFIPNKELVLTFTNETIEGKNLNSSEFIDATESYHLIEKDQTTKMIVKVNVPEEYYDEMNNMWDKALSSLKMIIETK